MQGAAPVASEAVDKADAKNALRKLVAEAVDRWRKEREGRTDGDFAEMLGYKGASKHATISSIRSGDRLPMTLVQKLADEHPDLLEDEDAFQRLFLAAKGIRVREPRRRQTPAAHRAGG